MVAVGHESPFLIITTIYLVRIASLSAAFITLYYKEGKYTNYDLVKTIQVIFCGQCLSCSPVIYWFMKKNKWPKANWTLISKELLSVFLSTVVWIGFIFCSSILLGAPLNKLRLIFVKLFFPLSNLMVKLFFPYFTDQHSN